MVFIGPLHLAFNQYVNREQARKQSYKALYFYLQMMLTRSTRCSISTAIEWHLQLNSLFSVGSLWDLCVFSLGYKFSKSTQTYIRPPSSNCEPCATVFAAGVNLRDMIPCGKL